MIVPNDSSSSDKDKWVVNSKASMHESLVPPNDSPPPYLDVEAPSAISSGSTSNRQLIPNIKPSNFVSLSRGNGSIKGSWLIDPSLFIPLSFLPPLRPTEIEGHRRNLLLESRNGAIDVDVFLPSTSHSNRNTSKFILIHTQSSNGCVKTKLHDAILSNGQVRLPVRLSTSSFNGPILVHLPRSFCGPLRIKIMNGTVHFSPAIQSHLTVFSEMDRVQRSFLSHFNSSQWDIGAPWEGDELSIESRNGSVKVFFDDEHVEASFSLLGHFSRFFSL